MNGHGGARPGAGRPAGMPNKVPKEVKLLAKQHTAIAISTLAEVMRDKAAPAIARVRAAEALLDRGHGRPTQHVEARISLLSELSDDELEAGIAALRSAIAPAAGHA